MLYFLYILICTNMYSHVMSMCHTEYTKVYIFFNKPKHALQQKQIGKTNKSLATKEAATERCGTLTGRLANKNRSVIFKCVYLYMHTNINTCKLFDLIHTHVFVILDLMTSITKLLIEVPSKRLKSVQYQFFYF